MSSPRPDQQVQISSSSRAWRNVTRSWFMRSPWTMRQVRSVRGRAWRRAGQSGGTGARGSVWRCRASSWVLFWSVRATAPYRGAVRRARWSVVGAWMAWWGVATVAFWLLGRVTDQSLGVVGSAVFAALAIVSG